MEARLRIHFGAGDMARLRVAAGPDPMWETVLSMHMLQTRRGTLFFDGWRQDIRRRLGGSARLLLALNPAVGSFPDFLTPAQGTTDLDTGIDAMLSTPRSRLRAELSALTFVSGMRSWLLAVADADTTALREFDRLFRAFHAGAVQPVWDDLVAQVHHERERLARAFLRGGPGAVLSCIGSVCGCDSPVLDLPYPVDRDLFLGGRGLLLIPSYFCWKHPVTLVDPGLSPVLVYPTRHLYPVALQARRSDGDRSLAALIGSTRAAILRSLEVPCSTTDLANRAGTSIASASRHASILRGAGLITTERSAGAVVHHLTSLGATLLHAQTR